MLHRIFGCVLTVVVLAACGGPSEADIQATVGAAIVGTTTAVAATAAADVCGAAALNDYAAVIEEQIKSFEMQATLTGSTPRVSMGTPLQELLNIQNATRRMETPECLAAYHERVVGAMGLYRLAYETFAAQGDETLVQASLEVGAQTFTDVKNDLATIRQGQIPPTPLPLTPTPWREPGDAPAQSIVLVVECMLRRGSIDVKPRSRDHPAA